MSLCPAALLRSGRLLDMEQKREESQATKLAQFRNIDYLFNIYRNDKFIHQQRWLVKKIRCMEVSSKDVAKFADVSQTTVSRLLNAPGRVKKTLKKVMDAIEELNYITRWQCRIASPAENADDSADFRPAA